MQPADLIAAAMKHSEIASMRKLAEELGVSHTIVSRWASGERVPDFEHAAALAELAGLPPTSTAAKLRMITAEGRRVRALLGRIATAAVVCLAVYTSMHIDGFDGNAAYLTIAGLSRHCAL